MRVFHEAIRIAMSPLMKYDLREFIVKSRKQVECKGVSLLESYCCNIFETKFDKGRLQVLRRCNQLPVSFQPD